MLDLHSFGRRVLRILRNHKYRLTFASDVLLFVGAEHDRESAVYGPYRYDQTAIDTMSCDLVHDVIRRQGVYGPRSEWSFQ